MEDDKIKEKIATMLPLLNEKQRRLFLGAEAISYGWGGIIKIAELSSESRFLVARGVNEIKNPELQSESKSIRHSGGGRKKEIAGFSFFSIAVAMLNIYRLKINIVECIYVDFR